MIYRITINSPQTTAQYHIEAANMEAAKREAREIARAHVMPARISISMQDYPQLSLNAQHATTPFYWHAAGVAVAEKELPAETRKDWAV